MGQMSGALQEEYPILSLLTPTPGPPRGRSMCVASPLCVPDPQQKVVTPSVLYRKQAHIKYSS